MKKAKAFPMHFKMILFLLAILTLTTGALLTISSVPYHMEILLLGAFILLLSLAKIGYKILSLGFYFLTLLIKK